MEEKERTCPAKQLQLVSRVLIVYKAASDIFSYLFIFPIILLEYSKRRQEMNDKNFTKNTETIFISNKNLYQMSNQHYSTIKINFISLHLPFN